MAKAPTLTDVGSGFLSATSINANNDAIETAFNNTLSRDGSSPNQMEADIDMNSNDLLNVKDISVQTLTIAGVAATASSLAEDQLAGFVFDTKADLEAASVDSNRGTVVLFGHTTLGDGGAARYKRVDAQPPHDFAIRSTDRYLSTGVTDATNGGWWEGIADTGYVKPQYFGAVPGGLTDSTAAVQSAVDWVLANGSLSTGGETTELRHGYPAIYFDSWFAVSNTLTFSGKFGVTLFGNGALSSGLIFTGTSGTLVSMVGWGNFDAHDIGFVAGTVTEGVDGKADIDLETGGVRTNVCFDMDGDGGGTQFVRRNVLMEGWSVVDQSINSTVNGDNVRAYDCLISQNDLVADNTNNQAVIWRYVNCKFRHNQNTFKNLGNNFFILGCDIIDKGKFLEFTGITSIGEGGVVEGCKFEDYQNIDATTNPQWLVTSGASNVEVLFRDCDSTTGSTYAKTGMSLAGGTTRVTFDHCELTGELEITSGSSVGGITPTLIFDNSVIPTITQTLVVGQGNTPINLVVRNSRLAAEVNVHQVISRQFWGSLNSASDEISVSPMKVGTGYSATINNTSSGKDVPIWCPSPYQLAVMGARIVAEHNTTGAFDIILWTDSTKTTKILEVTGVGTGTSGVPFFEEVRQDGLTTETILDSTSNPVYLEVTSAVNAGTIFVRVEIDLMQATL